MSDVAVPRSGLARTLERLSRLAALLIGLAIVALSVVPPGLRPVTAPQNIEHAAIFMLLGVALGLAAPGRILFQVATAVVFTATVELMQVLAPGRHARWSDLAVDTLGALAGLVVAALVLRLARRLGRPGD